MRFGTSSWIPTAPPLLDPVALGGSPSAEWEQPGAWRVLWSSVPVLCSLLVGGGGIEDVQGFGNLMLVGLGWGSGSSSVRVHSLFPSARVPERLLWGGSALGTAQQVCSRHREYSGEQRAAIPVCGSYVLG